MSLFSWIFFANIKCFILHQTIIRIVLICDDVAVPIFYDNNYDHLFMFFANTHFEYR